MDYIKTIKKLFRTGFFHIFGAGTINKILGALMSIILVRILSKEDYGCYAYAFNIASFFILFNGLGATSAFLQIGSELYRDKHASDKMYAYSYRVGIIADLVMAAIIVIVGMFIPLAIEGSSLLLIMYCAYPLLSFLVELKLTYLRVQLKNQEYSFMTNVNTVFIVVFVIAGAYIFQAVGLVAGQLLSCFATYVVLCVKFPFRSLPLAREITQTERNDFWSISSISALNNAIGHALTLVGTFLIGILLTNAELVASYKVATTIPFALLFIPSMLVTYIYPFFARNKGNREWTIRNYKKLIGCSVLLMGVVSLILCFFADSIIVFLFGEQYLDAAAPMRLLMIGFFITASFRQPTGNLLVTQRKLVSNTIIGLLSVVFCVVFSYLLIPEYGMMGAAGVYTLTMLFGAIANVSKYVYTINRI